MDKYKEKISIIIPVYCAEKFLQRCVESVCNQTYRNLEIFLVDDGSPDNCPQMCDEFAKTDDRITVLHKENGGVSSARNLALDNATGEYILCVDSDDYIHPCAVEKLYNACVSYDADISIAYNYIETDNQLMIEDPIIDEVEIFNTFEALQTLLGDKKMRHYPHNKLYKSELFKDIHYPAGRCYEDVATTYLLFHKANRICRIPEYLYYYQKHENSISCNINMEKWYKNCKDIVWAYKQQLEYFERKNEHQLAQISLYHWVRNTYSLIDAGYQLGYTKEAVSAIDSLITRKHEIYTNELLNPEAKKRLKIYESLPGITGIYLKCKNILQKTIAIKNTLKSVFRYYGIGLKHTYDFTLAKGKDTRLVLFEQPCGDNLGKHSVIFSAQKTLELYTTKHDNCQLYIINGNDTLDGISELIQCIGENDIIFYPDINCKENFFPFNKAFSKQRTVIFSESAFSSTDERTHTHNNIAIDNIVSSLNMSYLAKDFNDRRGILLCLSFFNENGLKSTEKKRLQAICEELTDQLLISDTIVGYDISSADRESALTAKWQTFGSKKLVVTDSFQCMIFALITGTPCVIINTDLSDTDKIATDGESVFFAENTEQAEALIKQVYEMPEIKGKRISRDVVNELESLLK